MWRNTHAKVALVAAALNVTLIVMVPVLAYCWIKLATDHDGATASVDSKSIVRALAMSALALPFGASIVVVAWRTYVHARQALAGRSNGARGTLEAAAFGAVVPVMLFGRGVLERPVEGLGYVFGYGIIGAAVGLLLGVALWLFATGLIRVCLRPIAKASIHSSARL